MKLPLLTATMICTFLLFLGITNASATVKNQKLAGNILCRTLINQCGSNISTNIQPSDTSDNLVIKIETINFERILRVSIRRPEGQLGILKIFDSKGTQRVISNLELIMLPYHASVDISALPVGNYTVKLTTGKGTHTAILQII